MKWVNCPESSETSDNADGIAASEDYGQITTERSRFNGREVDGERIAEIDDFDVCSVNWITEIVRDIDRCGLQSLRIM